MTDRELLEKAAKAAGIELIDYCTKVAICFYDKKTQTPWDPLSSDGDALRLAVRLGMIVAVIDHPEVMEVNVSVFPDSNPFGCETKEPLGDDSYAATRRAIVRAAAAIGEQK